MSGRVRLFVAADVPEEHRALIADALGPWRARHPEARWTNPAAQHLTLKFLGYVEDEQFDEIAAVAAAAAARCAPGTVRMKGFGAFPTANRMRVLWAGIDDPSGVLASLAAGLAEEYARLGFEPEARPYRPHLTLARFKSPARLPDDLPDEALSALAPFEIDAAVLYRSHLSPKGARYEPLRSLPLEGGAEETG